MNTTFFEHEVTPQNSSVSPVENLASEVSEAFDRLSEVIQTSKILPSFSEVIGEYLLLDVQSHGFEKTYEESFSVSSETKDLVLSAEPIDIVAVSFTEPLSNNEVYLTGKLPSQSFTDSRQYKVVGRLLNLSGDIEGVTVKVIYTGLKKTFGNLKLKPNVIKDTDNTYVKQIERVGDTTYKVDYDFNITQSIAEVFNNPSLEANKIYLLNYDGTNYETVPFQAVTDQGSSLVFTLHEQFNFDQVVVYVSNTSISGFLEAFYKEFLTHSHSRDGLSDLVKHADLVNLYKNTNTIFYKDVDTVNYDHPQYFNREGYNQDLTSVYENAVLGDFFLAAKISEDDQDYKTLLKDSNSILFGDPIRGSKIYFDSSKKALCLLSGVGLDALSIQVGTEGEKALVINEESSLSEDSEKLIIRGKGDTIAFKPSSDIPGRAAHVTTDALTARLGIVSESITTGSVDLGNISVKRNGDDVLITARDQSILTRVTSLVSTNYESLEATYFNASVIQLNTGDRITNESETSDLISTESGFEVSGGTLTVSSNGKGTGLIVGSDNDLVIYTSDYTGGTVTTTDRGVYAEVAEEADLTLLQSTKGDLVYGEKVYRFRGDAENGVTQVNSLKDWRKATLNVGDAKAYTLTLLESDGVKKNGLSIGQTKISAIGKGLDCPAGMTLFESADTVSIIKPLPEDQIECSDVSYQSVNTGALQVFGTLSTDDSILSTENITAGEALIGRELSITESAVVREISVQDGATFSGEVEFNGSTRFLNSLTVEGSAEISGSVSATNLEVDNYLAVGGTFTVEGQCFLKNNVIIQGALSTTSGFTTTGPIQSDSLKTGPIESDRIHAVGGLSVEGKTVLTGPTVIDGGMNVNGNTLIQGSLESTSELTTNTLYVTEDTVIGGRLTVENSVVLEGSNIAIGTTGSTVTITGTLQLDAATTTFTGAVRIFKNVDIAEDLRVSGNIETSSTLGGTTLSVSASATVGGLLKADSGEFNRKTYFIEGLKANSDSEFTRIRSEELNVVDTVTTTLFVNEQLTMGPDSTLKTDNLITSGLKQTSSSAEVDFYGNVNFYNPVIVNKKFIVGNPNIENGRSTSGVLITDNEITMGNNSMIKATKVFATKGIPVGSDSDKNAGFCFEAASNNGSTDGDTGFFATVGNGASGSDLEFWIDGSRKAVIPNTTRAYNSVNAVDETVVTIKMLKEALSDLSTKVSQMGTSAGDRAWPINSIYHTYDTRNPYEIFGFGTWIKFAPGRVLVGSSNDSVAGGQISGGLVPPAAFNTTSIGSEYGAFEVRLNENQIPAHSHFSCSGGKEIAQGTGPILPGMARDGKMGYNLYSAEMSGKGSHPTQPYGKGEAHTNVQPSVVVNIWRRIS